MKIALEKFPTGVHERKSSEVVRPAEAEYRRIQNKRKRQEKECGRMRLRAIEMLKRCFYRLKNPSSNQRVAKVFLSDGEYQDTYVMAEVYSALKSLGYSCDFGLERVGVDPHNPRKEWVLTIGWK